VEGNKLAPTAEALMRSRYTAYTLLREDYLLATWHPSTRPHALGLAEDVPTKWLGLEVKRHEQQDADHAIVEFVARYKVSGRAHRLHEVSRFLREEGRWLYVDGEVT
jgi:SEC-C motif-containing protein